MFGKLLARVLAAWRRPSEARDQAPQVSALEAAGVDLSDLNLSDPEDLFAALRRVVNQSRLETWRAGRVPPHQRRPIPDVKDALSVYSDAPPVRLEIRPLRQRDRAVG